ncbi:hypothetical protein ABW20_dc0109741 [Dactylellina cionopaga]|nr:hypothetical protein ABW20_dc0109741 [Dactylellina cionopaga]
MEEKQKLSNPEPPQSEVETSNPELRPSKVEEASKPGFESHTSNSPSDPADPHPGLVISLARRVGWIAAILFFGSTIFTLACMGWFAFLWWGTIDNGVWHDIIINDWAVRAISLPSSLLRMAVTVQASACLSMLAALAIEKSYVPLPSLAAISVMRSSAPTTSETLLQFIYPLITSAPGIRDLGTLSIVTLTSLIVLTYSILGFTSTILLSDVVVQPVPSRSSNSTLLIDYAWKENGQTYSQDDGTLLQAKDFGYIPTKGNSYWKSGSPLIFPSFAEYSEASPAIPGVDDTGVTIRAFIPLSGSEERSRLWTYKGKAVVWDARVVCQKPKVSNFKIIYDKASNDPFAITGNIRKSVQDKIILEAKPEAAKFVCSIGRSTQVSGGALSAPIICQLPNSDIGTVGINLEQYNFPPLAYSGGLRSEFSLADRQSRNGGAYLILNRTYAFDIEDYMKDVPEWGEVGRIAGEVPDFDEVILGTLCYTPLDAVTRDVEISRRKTEAEPEFSSYKIEKIITDPAITDGGTSSVGTYTFDKIFPVFLPGSPRKQIETRGVFNLAPLKSGWASGETADTASDGPWVLNGNGNLTLPGQLPYIIDALFLKYQKPYALEFDQTDNWEIYGNYSVFLDEQFSDEETAYATTSYVTTGRNWMKDLYLAVKEHPEGGTALALQALLTSIASNAYYDTFQTLDRAELVSTASFLNVSSPGGPFGTRRGGEFESEQQGGYFNTRIKGRFPVGFAIVAVVLGVQIILAAVIMLRFLAETRLTRIGDPWQAIAQVAEEEFDGLDVIFEVSRKINAHRQDVADKMKSMGYDENRVGLEQHADSTKLANKGKGSGPA